MLAIQTKYIGPTDYRGSRVVAHVMEGNHNGHTTRRLTVEWDDGLGSEENHRAAAKALIVKLGWGDSNGYGQWIVGACEPGYVFVCNTKHGSDRMDV